jgi:putative DNA primase/helicase
MEVSRFGMSYPSGALVADEAGGLFGGYAMTADNGMKTFSALNKLWDGSTIDVDRRTKESFSLQGARLTAYLQTQPTTFTHFLKASGALARGIGFFGRFLFLRPPSTQGTRMYRDPPKDRPSLKALAKRLEMLLNKPPNIDLRTGALTLSTLDFSPAAKAAWIAAHNKIERELGPLGALRDIRDFAAKAADNVARVSAIFHVVETGSGGLIERSAVDRAYAVVRWHLNEALRIWGQIDLPRDVSDARELDAWLRAHCRKNQILEVSSTYILQFGPSCTRSKPARDAALQRLTAAHRVRIRPNGRAQMICLNPTLLTDSE